LGLEGNVSPPKKSKKKSSERKEERGGGWSGNRTSGRRGTCCAQIDGRVFEKQLKEKKEEENRLPS